MKIYLLWECYGFGMHYRLLDVYEHKQTAEEVKTILESQRAPEDKPDFDDYGQTEGIDYVIEERELL